MNKTEARGRVESHGEDLWWVTESSERIGNIVRCFPESAPDTWVSIRSDQDVELVLVRRIADLDETSRKTVEPVLREKYLIPVITQILSIEGSSAGKMIRVQTTEVSDTLDVNSETDVDFRAYPRILFNDRTKRRKYVIEDADALGKTRQDLIRRHLRRSRGRRGRGFR